MLEVRTLCQAATCNVKPGGEGAGHAWLKGLEGDGDTVGFGVPSEEDEGVGAVGQVG